MFDPTALLNIAIEQIVSWTPAVLGALAILFFGRLFAGWAKKLTRTLLEASEVDPVLVPFVSGLVHVALIAVVAIAAVDTLGVSAASFVAVLGAAGLAVALAFQGTFSNFAAGVMLLTFRPFDLGDFVEVGGNAGSVKEIGIFSTVLATGDNVQIRVPNSNVFGNTIKNYSANDTRRIDLVVGVGYDDDLGLAVQTCRRIVDADARILDDPEAVVAVHELADSSVNLVVRPWVAAEDYWATRWDLTRTLKEQLEAAGLSIPYPQRDVHMHAVAGD